MEAHTTSSEADPSLRWWCEAVPQRMEIFATQIPSGRKVSANAVAVPDCERWTDLGSFTTALGCADLASKAHVLKYLSSFLLCATATVRLPSPTAVEELVLPAFVGTTKVGLQYDGLMDLHDLLFQELAQRVPLFSDSCSTAGRCGTTNYGTMSMAQMQIKVTGYVLRCCIHILPLIELFDTGLRNKAGIALDALFQKLCSPSDLWLFLGRGADKLQSHSQGQVMSMRSICFECQQQPQEYMGGGTAARAMSMNDGSHPGRDCMDCGAMEEHASEILPHRALTFCAMLEVYMDEQLLHPDISFLEETTHGPLDEDVCPILDAAFMHIVLSLLSTSESHLLYCLPGLCGPKIRNCGLSLQAGVKLLDSAINHGMPRLFLSHVANLVAGGLEEAATPPHGQTASCKINLDSGLSSFKGPEKIDSLPEFPAIAALPRKWFARLSYLSYFTRDYQSVSTERDSIDLKSSPPQVTLSLASAVLERAVCLYMRPHQGSSNSSLVSVDHSLQGRCAEEVTGAHEQTLHGVTPACYVGAIVGILFEVLEDPLFEVVQQKAAPIILQTNNFLNDLCEFMDNLLSSSAWREVVLTEREREIVERQRHRKLQTINRETRPDVFQGGRGPCIYCGEAELGTPQNGTGSFSGEEDKIVHEVPCRSSREGCPTMEPVKGQPTHDCGVSAQAEGSTPEKRGISLLEWNQLRPSTLDIMKKMKLARSPDGSCTSHRDRLLPESVSEAKKSPSLAAPVCTSHIEPTEGGNQYVTEVLKLERTSDKDNFDDLKDFIVCKKSRSYTKWLSQRIKCRRRQHTGEIWKRLQEKRKLLSLLDLV